jgi:uncharacterized protein (DUF697 family)
VPFGPGNKSGKSKGGKTAGARQLVSLVRGLSIEEIEEAVRQPPRILFVSAEPDIDVMIAELTGMRQMPTIEVVSPNAIPRDLGQYDVIVVHSRSSNSVYLDVRKRAGIAGHRVFDAGQAVDIAELRSRIVEHAGNGTAALGRWYPGFRDAAATAIIGETSRANAQFALMTAVPSAIPVIGTFATAGADIIVLTRNQLLMAIKLAAVHGKPFGDKMAIFKDLMPVIGSGFVWRSLAREAIVFLPFAAGTIPRVAIAFAGTYTTGRAVDAYYRFGKKPTKTQLNDYYQQAMAILKSRFAKPKAVTEPETAAPVG